MSMTSDYNDFKYEKELASIHTYCMFIGYPRSGHSLVGSLLDAHPNIIIAHELDTLYHLQQGFNQKQCFSLLLENSKRFAEEGRMWGKYSYLVPNQWNGRFQQLRVIGDKKGGRTNKRLLREPELFNLLLEQITLPIKMIHVTRNPFDNISTISRKRYSGDLSKAISRYFMLCDGTNTVRAKISKQNWLDIRHEELIQSPEPSLRRLYHFLGEEASPNLLKDGASIIYKSPHKTRYDAPWTSDLIYMVEDKIKKYNFLDGYRYDD